MTFYVPRAERLPSQIGAQITQSKITISIGVQYIFTQIIATIMALKFYLKILTLWAALGISTVN
ncbi:MULTISPECIES: hypothetical protein [unclassified Microcoleus]|uniref:hypothetical protein n=1 Tax=unclassified Microcoleus TaxID=2642155 RepID=UPI002FD3499E